MNTQSGSILAILSFLHRSLISRLVEYDPVSAPVAAIHASCLSLLTATVFARHNVKCLFRIVWTFRQKVSLMNSFGYFHQEFHRNFLQKFIRWFCQSNPPGMSHELLLRFPLRGRGFPPWSSTKKTSGDLFFKNSSGIFLRLHREFLRIFSIIRPDFSRNISRIFQSSSSTGKPPWIDYWSSHRLIEQKCFGKLIERTIIVNMKWNSSEVASNNSLHSLREFVQSSSENFSKVSPGISLDFFWEFWEFLWKLFRISIGNSSRFLPEIPPAIHLDF